MLVEYYMARAMKAHAEFLDRLVLGNPASDLLIANYPRETPETKVRGVIPNSLIQFVEDDLCT